MPRPAVATRERILRAAFTRFASYGFRRTSMEDIAGAAGVSRAALYLQFRNKEAIFLALAEELHGQSLTGVEAALAGAATLPERLRAAVEAKTLRFVEIAYGSPHGSELLDESNRLCGNLAANAEQRFRTLLARVFRRAAARRRDRPRGRVADAGGRGGPVHPQRLGAQRAGRDRRDLPDARRRPRARLRGRPGTTDGADQSPCALVVRAIRGSLSIPGQAVRLPGREDAVGLPFGNTPRPSQSTEDPMQYALLIYDDEANAPERWDAARREALFAEYAKMRADMVAQGVFVAAQRLAPTDAATTVHVRNGEALVTDGPFAETKEALGGFFLIECADLDAALAWAGRIPSARQGRIEVRPVFGSA